MEALRAREHPRATAQLLSSRAAANGEELSNRNWAAVAKDASLLALREDRRGPDTRQKPCSRNNYPKYGLLHPFPIKTEVKGALGIHDYRKFQRDVLLGRETCIVDSNRLTPGTTQPISVFHVSLER